jgi:hypothetical protein
MSGEAIGQAYADCLDLITSMCGPGDRVVVLEDDQSRFDLHLTKGPFEFLQQVYRQKLPKHVAEGLRRGKSRGRSNLGTKYEIPYTMQSGWPDTSVGDTWVNARMKHHIHVTGAPWVSIICGDDSVTVTLQSEIDLLGGVKAITAEYALFGMEVEMVLRTDPLDAEFCSGRFYPVGETYVLMPKTGRALMKMCIDMKQRNHEGQLAWLRGIAITLLHFGKVDPLMAALGRGLQRELGSGKVITERFNPYAKSIAGNTSAPWWDTLVYYNQHYDMSEADVLHCIHRLENIKLGEICDDPLIVAIAHNDV